MKEESSTIVTQGAGGGNLSNELNQVRLLIEAASEGMEVWHTVLLRQEGRRTKHPLETLRKVMLLLLLLMLLWLLLSSSHCYIVSVI